jgi:hypothetical protein
MLAIEIRNVSRYLMEIQVIHVNGDACSLLPIEDTCYDGLSKKKMSLGGEGKKICNVTRLTEAYQSNSSAHL